MTLSTLAIVLGLALALPQIYTLLRPKEAAAALKKFPRSVGWGYLLMGAGTAWFLINLNREAISDFAAYKRIMLFGFGAVGLLTCVFVKDFLAVRGLAVLLLLVSKLTLDTARWHNSEWKLLFSIVAYVWILGAMWLVVSPWRLRDWIHWQTATEKRIRIAGGVPLGIGLLMVVLGIVAF